MGRFTKTDLESVEIQKKILNELINITTELKNMNRNLLMVNNELLRLR